MLLKVINIYNNTLEIRIDRDQTVQHLREAIEALGEAIPGYQILFRGKPLLDEDTMWQVGVKDGDKLHMIVPNRKA